MLFRSIGAMSAVFGYLLAYYLDASIAGSMATMTGVFFLLALFCSPKQGLLFKLLRFKEQKIVFASHMLVVQLLDHEDQDNESMENTISNMVHHMGWTLAFAKQVAARSVQEGYISRTDNHLKLTALGREVAKQVMVNH